MTSLADLTVRRRKMTLRVKDMTSAMGKAHHTSSNCPVRDSSHDTGSSQKVTTRDHVFHKSISSCYLEAFVLFAALAHGP